MPPDPSWIPLFAILGGILAPTLATVIGVALTNRNASRAARIAAVTLTETREARTQTDGKLNEIHVLVNSRLALALEKIAELEARLLDLTGLQPTGEPRPAIDPHAQRGALP